MRKKVDMSKVQESGSFELVAEGKHYARIEEANEKITENGDPMIGIKLTIITGVSQDLWLWDNLVISDNPDSPGYKILGRTKHFLHCIGEPYEGEIEIDTDSWIEKEVKIEVYHDEFINKRGQKTIRAKVKNYFFDLEEVKEESPF